MISYTGAKIPYDTAEDNNLSHFHISHCEEMPFYFEASFADSYES